MSLNKVMLIGNVGQDPEVRYLPNSQTKVASLRLATSDRRNDRNGGEPREFTEWHSIVCWRNLADLAEKFIRKGSQIYVEGRIQTREWTDQSGAKRYTTEIVAENVQLLGKRPEGQGAPAGYGQGGNSAPMQSGYSAPAQAQPGYSNPYQPSYQNVTPAPAPAVQTPSAPAAGDFGAPGTDDLPF